MPQAQGHTTVTSREALDCMARIEERLRIAERVFELIGEADRAARFRDGTPTREAWDAICRAAL